MFRIRCLPSKFDQTVLFCQNNDIPYSSVENSFDLIFTTLEHCHEASKFQLRLDEIDRQDKVVIEEVVALDHQ